MIYKRSNILRYNSIYPFNLYTPIPKIEMSEIVLNFTNNPGAVQYGNFINYYSFHTAKERISNLHSCMFPAPPPDNLIICLDIGCNTGELTKEVYQYLQSSVYPNSKIKILGVDIDSTLIERAKEQNNESNISYISLNITKSEEQSIIQQYLSSNNKQKFDIIFCFSVTMWIHINIGDDGLLQFLKYIKSLTRSIVIEPQPWKCYRNAQRRLVRAGKNFPLYKILKIRNNVNKVIENILLENDMTKVYESPSTWDRKILSFHLTSLM